MDYYSLKSISSIKEAYVKSEYSIQIQLFRYIFRNFHKKVFEINDQSLESLFSFENIGKNIPVNLSISVLKALLNKEKVYDFEIGSDYNIISDTILKIFDGTNEDLRFLDLFDKCHGRSVVPNNFDYENQWFVVIEGKQFRLRYNEIQIGDSFVSINKEQRIVQIENEEIPFRWLKKENQIEFKIEEEPEVSYFCDGRKTKKVDSRTNEEFFWCTNRYCFKPNQYDHTTFEWRYYTLRDFIKILNIELNDDWYYRFVGILNRTNFFLYHLRCNECNHYLRDVATSNFAFYRVTRFHCINENCSEYKKVIYLNHCLNWACHNIIDSRNSIQCSNGWYVCNDCGICCIHEKNIDLLEKYQDLGIFNPKSEMHAKLEEQVTKKLAHYIIKDGKILPNSEEEPNN